MIETATIIGLVGIMVAALGAIYYKLGRLEGKVEFIYDNLKTVVSFKNNNKK